MKESSKAVSTKRPKKAAERRKVPSQIEPKATPAARLKFSPEQVERALRTSQGFYTRAAALLAGETGGTCDRHTVARAVRRSKRLQDVMCELVEANLDHAENALLTKIAEGHLPAITFYLRTKGRRRGYTAPADKPGDAPVPVSLQLPQRIEDAEEWARAHGPAREGADES